jgi:hypothetical protein
VLKEQRKVVENVAHNLLMLCVSFNVACRSAERAPSLAINFDAEPAGVGIDGGRDHTQIVVQFDKWGTWLELPSHAKCLKKAALHA